MKIYFTASIPGKRFFLNNYIQIVNTCKRLGCDVFFDPRLLSIKDQTQNRGIDYLDYLDHMLAVDGFIAEISYPSIDVGFEICRAVDRNVPGLLVHANNVGNRLITSVFDKGKLNLEYYTVDSLKNILESAIDELAKMQNDRFTMLMPKKLTHYLDSLAQKGTVRSEYIRELIFKDMERTASLRLP